MGKIIDTIERALFGATAAEMVEMRTELVARRVEARFVAALEVPDEAHRCPGCGGEGYVLAADRIHEDMCADCGGTGLRQEGDDAVPA